MDLRLGLVAAELVIDCEKTHEAKVIVPLSQHAVAVEQRIVVA
jgi:hypothetical protein